MAWIEIEDVREPWWRDWLKPKTALAVAGLMILIAVPLFHRDRPLVECGPYDPPYQAALASYKPLPGPPDFEIFGTHEYEIDALIMSRKRYRFDQESQLAPIDLLLAWGPLTTEPVLSEIQWKQSGRWGHYRYKRLSVPSEVVAANSANTHIIPAFDDEQLRKELLHLDRGDAVRLSGYLVSVTGKDGWKWDSSHSRTDKGDGACEVFYVTDLEFLN